MKKGQFSALIIITATFIICTAILIATRYHSDHMPILGDTSAPVTGNHILTDGKININSATLEQLCMLPDVGETLAKRIIDYREKKGHINNTVDLTKIKGINDALIEKINDYITFDD